MSTLPFVIPGVLAPLQGLWRWLMPTSSRATRSGLDQREHPFAINTIAGNAHFARAEPQKVSQSLPHRPLRIVRILEAGQAPSQVGRMVISGRMSEVCAELDRLAACEATLH
jgi:hypothetical protein